MNLKEKKRGTCKKYFWTRFSWICLKYSSRLRLNRICSSCPKKHLRSFLEIQLLVSLNTHCFRRSPRDSILTPKTQRRSWRKSRRSQTVQALPRKAQSLTFWLICLSMWDYLWSTCGNWSLTSNFQVSLMTKLFLKLCSSKWPKMYYQARNLQTCSFSTEESKLLLTISILTYLLLSRTLTHF